MKPKSKYASERIAALGPRTKRVRRKQLAAAPVPARRPAKAAGPVALDDCYQCIVCRKQFGDATGFKAHYVHKFTRKERCLTALELRALDFAQSTPV